ncbi:tetratricopeptide repeat protein [Pontibacter sp. HSC-14F20]|uniref:tetratricopeptide repeat protein n=1 Tax=Pontibacter sp. HSC-14F20 TaxID=2864136 RepID=UPI001C72D755|nr:tetratricopeptide repeat protein [Pontibacter sp. HSC-14F20]MBX0331688.1 tetratricopeptide repeat protein [Pontibacter sp. HSC-14F20]
MKHNKKKAALFLPLAVVMLSANTGCTLQRMAKQAEKQQIEVIPNPLVANGEEVVFEIKATLPEKMLKNNEDYRYKIDVVYEADGQQREHLGALNFDIGNYLYDNRRPTITQEFSFPYAPHKNKGKLLVQGTVIEKRKRDRVAYTSEEQVATGLNTTALLMVRNNDYTYVPDNYKEYADGPGTILFYFDENTFTTKSYLGENLPLLDQYAMDTVKQQTIKVIGSQAPNEKGTDLAQKRASALANYYRTKVKALDYAGKMVDISTEVESTDWSSLVERVNKSALPKAQKQEVLAILQGTGADKQKADALQQSAAFDYISRYVYPTMRFARVEVDYNRARKSDYELYLLARRIADDSISAQVLTAEELQYAATLTPLLAERRKLYEAAVKTTDKWPAYYNLGVVYTEMARKEYRTKAKEALLDKAIHNLNFAGFRNPTAEVNYALASAYHLRGNRDKALQIYDYAIKLGGEQELLHRIFADKAALEMEMGLYDDAIRSLTYSGDDYQTNMNLGLSYLLKENYEGARQYYEKALELKEEDPLAHYLLAVLGARMQNEGMIRIHLRRAIQRDRSYMERAFDDPEFEAYHGKQAFREAMIR